MTGVRLDTNGTPAEGAGERCQQGSQEHKEVRDGTSGDGQDLLEEDESRMNGDVNNGHAELSESQPLSAGQHTQRKQPQGLHAFPGQVVCWERFLPLRALKVLLVESDDSTRHVVSALLRNCSYEVTAVANGLEAWKILEDLNHIDLVLTEVDMPSLSGIGLLSKIMNNTCSNIPVIMMSSNDSMGIVFTCLSKGATDFLVKPIRKNELKNLWQHVWRKCHSSSGSGSESGIRTQKSTKSKSVEGSKNDTHSNDGDDNGSIGLNARDGSDNGSGTQSSWSKRAVEFDSLQSMSPCDELADPLDSTCTKAIHLRPEATRNAEKLNNEHELQGQSHSVMGTTMGTEKDKPSNLESKGEENKLERGNVDLNHEAPTNELLNDAAGSAGGTINSSILQVDSIGNEVSKHPSSNISTMGDYNTKQVPSLELCLEQNRDASDIGTSVQECNLLRHSGPSAFSRYTKSKITTQAPTGNVGSCSPVDNSSEVAKVDSTHNFISSSSGTPNARSNGSSNNNDMGSTTDNVCTKPDASGDRLAPKSAVNFRQNSAFQPVHQGSVSSLKPTSASQASAMNQDIQVQHHHHHYHHHHHHVHNLQQQQQLNCDELSSMNTTMKKIPHCAPSDIFATTIEGNAANYGSASGSNNGSGQNGSSGQNKSSTAIVAEGKNLTIENGQVGICRTGGGIGDGSTSILDQNRLARREAALTKFQQKRKERCFDKKVRYQSRKRLAEQRPRVRGQFVRQAADENKRKDKS